MCMTVELLRFRRPRCEEREAVCTKCRPDRVHESVQIAWRGKLARESAPSRAGNVARRSACGGDARAEQTGEDEGSAVT